jgi:hypothetical protein
MHIYLNKILLKIIKFNEKLFKKFAFLNSRFNFDWKKMRIKIIFRINSRNAIIRYYLIN